MAVKGTLFFLGFRLGECEVVVEGDDGGGSGDGEMAVCGMDVIPSACPMSNSPSVALGLCIEEGD